MRLTAAEAQAVRANAALTGRVTAVYLRDLALGHTPRARGDRQLDELIRTLCRVGNTLDSLGADPALATDADLRARLNAALDDITQATRAAHGPQRVRHLSPSSESRVELDA